MGAFLVSFAGFEVMFMWVHVCVTFRNNATRLAASIIETTKACTAEIITKWFISKE